MAVAGDSYIVEIGEAHLNWGTHRYTNSRGMVYGEGYIQIPKQYARNFDIYNSNYQNGDALGINIFNCSSDDGFLDDVQLKSCGNSFAGDTYAKQFQGNGSLQTIGAWYHHVGAQVGDYVEVTWTSPIDIVIRHL
ncbi:MAG: hypothetical protein ACRCX2_26345 [Paraclostridium sp.]